jgi:hypothetical protein
VVVKCGVAEKKNGKEGLLELITSPRVEAAEQDLSKFRMSSKHPFSEDVVTVYRNGTPFRLS